MIVRAVTSSEMREIDRMSIEEIGIPAEVLMNNAGKSIADFIKERFRDIQITIFCGPGNNGGDGFTAAYYLANNGIYPVIYLSCKKMKISGPSRVFLNLCEKMNVFINEVDENNLSIVQLPAKGVVIDAILGTGSSDVPKGIPYEFIKIINKSRNNVVSIDIPSGLGSDGEAPSGECVRADFTITIGFPKISLVTYPCKAFCGEVIVTDIGFPSFLTSDKKLQVSLINDSLFQTINIFDSNPDIHKGDKGHTLLIGGFRNMEGAALLTASALITTGCGLLTIATTSESRKIISGKFPEAMTLSLPDDPDSFELKDLIKSKRFTSVIIGPGLGRTPYAEKIFKNLINSIDKTNVKTVLIDGDGLFHLSDFIANDKLPGDINFIITPHFMEASRLLKKDIEILKMNRLKTCKELANFTGCVTVLKGPASIVSNGKISFVNTSGNNGLATAGSGDVLSGIIGSLMNKDIVAIEAAISGVYIHGLCADLYGKHSAVSTMSATDIINNIRSVIALKNVTKNI